MNPTEYRFGGYRLLPAARELWQDGRMLPVTRLAFDCIAYLVEHRQRAVGRDELVAALWGRVDVAEARVSELVLRARRTIGDDGQRQYAIRTVPGFGYRWVAETEAASAAPALPIAGAADAASDAHAADAGAPPAEPAPAPGRPDAGAEPAAPPAAASMPAMPVPAPPRARRSWTPLLRLGLALVLAAAALAYALRERAARPPAAPAANAALAVLPLDVDAPRDAGWVHLGAMDLVADRLRAAGLAVAPSENVLLALHGTPAPAKAAPPEALARALGVGAVVDGKATRRPENWKVALGASVGGVRHRVEAEHADVIEAARRAADLLLAALGRQAPVDAREGVAVEERLQQAQAALLANQLDTARAILGALPAPERDDPQVRYRLAVIDFRGGRLDEANAQLTHLLENPALGADAPLRAQAQIARGKVAFRRTEFDAAERDLGAALALLEGRAAAARDTADALATRGAARVGLHRYDGAAADLGRARSLFQEAGDRIGVAQADTNLGLLEAERGRPERALAYLLGAAAQFESAGATERVLAVRTTVVDVQLMLLRWDDALETSLRQWQMRAHAADPGLALLIGVDRVRALTGLGRHREAHALLADLAAQAAGTRPVVARYLHAADAELAWREGRTADAVAAADRALAAWPDDAGDSQRTRLVLVRQRAWLSARNGAPAADAPPAAPEQASPTLLVAAAERALRRDDAEAAERAYRAALQAADATGAPVDVAGVVTSYVPWLIARGRLDEAGALAGRVAAWAGHDFDCALLQVRVYHARGGREAWADALRQTQALAGERAIPAELSAPPG